METLKEELRGRDKLSGMHICPTEPCISEVCAGLGYDFLWIDTEHTAIDYQMLLYHLMGAKAGDTDILVHIPRNNQALAKRVLEMEPTGIIIPMVNTVQELDAAMQATLYPPYGIRGFGPLCVVRYGLDDADSFIALSRQQLVRYVQIEIKTATRNLKEMVRNSHMDCSILDPCDLSGPIGELNRVLEDYTGSLVDEAVAIINESRESSDVSTGSDDSEIIRYWHEKGINVTSTGSDYVHIMDGARRELDTMRQIQAKQGGQIP